jgi:hypothetical protein
MQTSKLRSAYHEAYAAFSSVAVPLLQFLFLLPCHGTRNRKAEIEKILPLAHGLLLMSIHDQHPIIETIGMAL